MTKSVSGCKSSHIEVPFNEPEPKQNFHDQKDASDAIQASKSVDGSDDTKDVSTDQVETRRVTLEVSDGNDQHKERDAPATYPAGWKLGAIIVGLCLACILVALVCIHTGFGLTKALRRYRG